MISFEHIEVVGFEPALRGMRNPKNSWDKSDSHRVYSEEEVENLLKLNAFMGDPYVVGPNDLKLAMQLVKGGSVHAKFRRMIVVYMDITAPLYWWKEFDTYKVGTVADSCSTMHKIHERDLTMMDFSVESILDENGMANAAYSLRYLINAFNVLRGRYIVTKDKKYWDQMIQMLPSSYNQKRTVMMNYEVLANIYESRKDHKLSEWHGLCKIIEVLPYSSIITGDEGTNSELHVDSKHSYRYDG